MKTEHTQGPWTFSIEEQGRCVVRSQTTGLPYVAQVLSINARLIAAAPDLLAELHSVRVQLEAQALGFTASEIWPHVRTEIVRRISDAIKKAEGKA